MNELKTKVCNECRESLPVCDYGYSPSRGTFFAKCLKCTKNRRKSGYKKDPNLLFSPWHRKKKAIDERGRLVY